MFTYLRELFVADTQKWHPTPVLLLGKSHGWRSLVGCSPWGLEESDTTERLHFHLSLLCIGEGNGNPLRCSCLENPRDGVAWRAAVYGVAQSRTRLKRLSSSSSSNRYSQIHQRYSQNITRAKELTTPSHTHRHTPPCQISVQMDHSEMPQKYLSIIGELNTAYIYGGHCSKDSTYTTCLILIRLSN